MAKSIEIIKNIFINPRKAFTIIASNNYLKEGIFIFIVISLFKILKIIYLIPNTISSQLSDKFSHFLNLPLNIQTFIITPLYNIGALIFAIVAIKLIADILNRNIRHGLKSFFVALCFMQSIEFLTGKIMEPSAGMNKTILVGQCQYNKNKDHPNIQELVPIRGCPPSTEDIKNALDVCGIKYNPLMFEDESSDAAGIIFLQKYKGKTEFKESFYKLK